MATGSFMMGTLKGKLGETVAMRRNGKQVVRAYISNPKNPNSQKQQVQRMVQATAAQAYSAMKKICDHSFEGVQVGQKSMSYFMSKNMDYLRASIAANSDGTLKNASADYVRKGVNLPVLNKYVVGKGTLPAVKIADNPSEGSVKLDGDNVLVIDKAVTAQANALFSDWIIRNSGEVGDWFTFLFLLRENGNTQSGQQVYRFAFVRFVVENVSVSEDPVYALSPSLTNNGIPSADYETVQKSSWVEGDTKAALYLNFTELLPNLGSEQGQQSICAYAVIHSRQNVGGSWQRSNAEFVIRDNWVALGITYPSDFEGALASYSGAGEAKGTGDYVLNGGV